MSVAATSVAAPIPTTAPASRRWLFGPWSDLFLGCGLAYAIVFAMLCVAGGQILGIQPPSLIPFLLIVFCGVPHYGATLLRVYERSEDRRAYTFFTVYVTIVVWAAFALGVHWVAFGSALLTLYLTWSPWHYTGQNYGLALMFLRRRGIAFDAGTKKWIYASFFLSFLLTFLTMHGRGPDAAYAPVSYAGTVYRFLPLGLPPIFRTAGIGLCAVAYAVTLGVAFGRLRRGASSWGDLLPTALLTASQSLWFAVPVMVREWGIPGLSALMPFGLDATGYTFVWIAAAHSVQYLWVTTYYASAAGLPRGKAHYLGKTLLAGAAIWTVPPLLFAPGILGRVPFDAGLALLGAATVNLHHFLLDGAIWKLRDGRVARVLLRPPTAGESAASIGLAPRRRWVAPAVWATGAASFALILGAWWIANVQFVRAVVAADVPGAEAAVSRLAWVGRDGPDLYVKIGQLKARSGDLAGARAAYLRSLAVHPTAEAHLGLAMLHEHDGQWMAALEAYDAALALAPGNVMAVYRGGLALQKLGDGAASRERLERAAALAPGDRLVQLSLERARQSD